MMSKDTHIRLENEEIILLHKLKESIYNYGIKNISNTKIIRYAIRTLENENKESIIKEMGAMNIL